MRTSAVAQGVRRARRTSVRLCAAVLLATLAAMPFSRAPAQEQATEYQIKAAYLYKFLGYVEWPESVRQWPDNPIVVGVIGSDALAEELAAVAEKRNAPGHQVAVRKLRAQDAIGGLHVLFIGNGAGAKAAEILANAKSQPVLTVTESQAAFDSGSVINFVVVDERIRFDVALQPAERGNIRISSRLLSVARRVI